MPTTTPIILYSAPQSLYAGRARSYLIKSALPYEEHTSAQPYYFEEIVPKAGGRASWPTIELPDGTVIRDSVAIVDHFEAARGHPSRPPGPRQQIVSLLFDVIGAEGLLRPSMHYRWNFDDVQLGFLRYHFGTAAGGDYDRAEATMHRIRTTVNPDWGLTDATIPLIERLYLGFLEKFDTHLANHPHLLGGLPCVGDFGLAAPLYGHLGRDPVPLRLMQTQAPWVLRWVERMNKPEPDTSEYQPLGNTLSCRTTRYRRPSSTCLHTSRSTSSPRPSPRMTPSTHGWTLTTFRSAANASAMQGMPRSRWKPRRSTSKPQPFRFYLLARVHDAVAALPAVEQQAARSLLAACGMGDILDLRLNRRIGRANNLEVWLD